MAKMTEAEWKAHLVGEPRMARLGTGRRDGRPHVEMLVVVAPRHVVAQKAASD